MATKQVHKKTFDCVAFKQEAQDKLIAEYKRRGNEFTSYEEFLRAAVREEPWAHAVWNRFSSASPGRP